MGDSSHKKTNLKKIYGHGGDQALALKLLNNMNNRKK